MLDSTGLTSHGPGEWDRLKHGEKRRSWRKLHIALDAGTGEVLAHELTDSDTSDAAHGGTERERHASEIGAHGRMAWQKAHGYGRRALVETAISRLKRRGGDRLTARSLEAQRKEIATRIAVANKAIHHAKPIIERVV